MVSMRQLTALIATSRPMVGLIVILCTTYAFRSVVHDTRLPIVLFSLPLALITMAGFTLNDCYDVDKDRHASKYKPVALRIVSLRDGYIWAVCQALSGLVIAALLPLPRAALYTLLGTLAGVSAYSYLSQQWPILKGV